MRTYKLTIAYDGTRYQGWQRQSNTENTIQGILEDAVMKETGRRTEVNGSGRTDAGVHARGQTASIVLPGKILSEEFTARLNERLPADIRVLQTELVKNGFHARKSAVGKVYEYHIDTGDRPDVFTRRFSFHFPRRLDLEAMREAAEHEAKIPLAYVGSILDRCQEQGIHTLEAWQAAHRGSGAQKRVDRPIPSGNNFLEDAMSRPRRHKRKE